MQFLHRYSIPRQEKQGILLWDVAVAVVVSSILVSMLFGAVHMQGTYELGQSIHIQTSFAALPIYACMTTLRMILGLLVSLIFTFCIGTLAAKNAHAERFLIPFIDIMQSVPVLGFLSVAAIFFINLFPGSRLGPECAAIFAIFTTQVWNMALSFYQSLRTLPKELEEAAAIYHLSGWKKFWKVEVPHAMPGLLWNAMISMSGAWFFVVESEAFTIARTTVTLPGIGSFIRIATENEDYTALAGAILTMVIVIMLYDQLLFRPLIAWSDKFRSESSDEYEESESWFLDWLQRSAWVHRLFEAWEDMKDAFRIPKAWQRPQRRFSTRWQSLQERCAYMLLGAWYLGLAVALSYGAVELYHSINTHLSFQEVLHVAFLGAITLVKVSLLIVICSLLWVPVGIWVGLRPRWVGKIQGAIQFLAAFPPQLFYPAVFYAIVHYQLDMNLFSAPLIILGTQWYILFNVIAGISALPKDLILAGRNYGLSGWRLWRTVLLPGIFPFYVTGAMTAAGGCWNTTIVAELVRYGDTTLTATGLGSYLRMHIESGDMPRSALGLLVMSLYVLLMNRLFWYRLYELAQERFSVMR